MPFNPAKPADGSPLDAAEMREQLTALKALIDAQAVLIAAMQAQLAALVAQLSALANLTPIGGVIPWFKDTPGVPPLPVNFVECNGQTLLDADSPLNGQTMPDINTAAQRFVRGGVTSGTTGGWDSFGLAQADNSGTQPPNNFVTPDFSPGASPLPPYIEAVFIIRVK